MENTDKIRINTLRQMEKTEGHYKLGFIAAAVLELAFIVSLLLLADLSNRSHLIMLIAAFAVYTILAAGLVILGIHINRSTLRVIRAIETIDEGGR